MKSKLNDAELIAEAYANVEVQEEMLGALAAGAGAVARGAGSAARGVGRALTSEPAKKIYKGAGTVAKKAAETVGGAALGAASGAAGGAAKAVSGIAQGAIEGTVGAVQGAVDGATGGIGSAARGAGENIAGSFAGDEEGDFPAADHDAPKGGFGSRSMDREELKARLGKAKSEGDIGRSDANDILRMHDNDEADEHDGKQAGHPAGAGTFEARNARAHELKMTKAKAGIEDAEHDAPIEVDMSVNPAPESLEVSKEVETPCDKIAAPSIQPSIPTPSVNHHDDSEVKMALAELYKIEKYAFALGLMMKETNALEGWTAAKITKAADYLGSVFHKLDYDFHADATDHSDIAPEDHEGH
jgi:hypothetical protein